MVSTMAPAAEAVDGIVDEVDDDDGDVAGAEDGVVNDKGNTECGNSAKIITVKKSVSNKNSSQENGTGSANLNKIKRHSLIINC